MKNFKNKFKNNKALGNAVLGMIITIFIIFSLAMILDMFYKSISERELQNQIEMGQLYALIKSIDVDATEMAGELKFYGSNGSAAEHYFKQYMNEALTTKQSSGFYIADVETATNSREFIDVTEGWEDAYMFGDKVKRKFVSAKSTIEYQPISSFGRKKPAKVHAITRIFIDTEAELNHEDDGPTTIL